MCGNCVSLPEKKSIKLTIEIPIKSTILIQSSPLTPLPLNSNNIRIIHSN